MKRFVPLALLSLVLSFAAGASGVYQPGGPGPRDPAPRWGRVPDLNGVWYNGGDEEQPCRIIQRRGSTRATFINERGTRAAGTIRGNRVFIPSWGEDEGGLEGVIRGDRIVWPDGNYWQR
jgi:hypothetical protein